MGSKGSSSGGGSQSQTSAYVPTALPQMQDLYQRVLATSNIPYQPFTPAAQQHIQDTIAPLVAPLNSTQQAGISNINQYVNSGGSQPLFQQAAGYANQSAQPIIGDQDAIGQQLYGNQFANLTPQQQQAVSAQANKNVTRYQNPFQQQVIDTTLANINRQNKLQQQSIMGNSVAAGALGGDRRQVAQAELARNQDLSTNQILAQLASQNYGQALGSAQQDAGRQLNAAYTLGNLGASGQGAALQGAQAQIGAGTLEQQNLQQKIASEYGQHLQAQGYPFQVTQYLAGLGLPTLSAEGGTSSGTSTSSQSGSSSSFNPLSLLSLFGADGGRVNPFANGGGVGYAIGGSPTGTPYGFAGTNTGNDDFNKWVQYSMGSTNASGQGIVPLIDAPKNVTPPIGITHPNMPKEQMDNAGKSQQDMGKMAKGALSKMFNAPSASAAPNTPNPLGGYNPQSTLSGTTGDPYMDSTGWNDAAPPGGGDSPFDMSQGWDESGMDFGSDGSQGWDEGGFSDFGGGEDFGGLIGGFARGGEVKPKTTMGGVPLMVDGLIQTAHKIKEGLHKMPKRQHYDKGGSVQPGLGGQILDFIDPTRIYNRLSAPHVPTVADDQQYILTQGTMSAGEPAFEDTGNPFAGPMSISPDAQGDVPRAASVSHPVMSRPQHRVAHQLSPAAYNQLAQQNAEGSVSQWQPYPFEGGNVISLPEARGNVAVEAAPQRVTERAPEREVTERREAREPMSLYERTRQILTGPALLPLDANEGKKGLFARMQGPTGYSRSADLHARQLLAHAAQVDMTGGNSKYQWYPSKGKDENGNLVDGAVRVPTTGNGAPQFFPNVTMLPRSAGHSSQPDDTLWNRATGFAQRDAEANMSLIGKPAEREKYIAQRTQYHFDEAKKRQSSGKAPFVGDNAPAPAVAAPSGMPTISSKEERDKLPAGTKYIGPDGKQYIKQ